MDFYIKNEIRDIKNFRFVEIEMYNLYVFRNFYFYSSLWLSLLINFIKILKIEF